jgi:hypothetical protein
MNKNDEHLTNGVDGVADAFDFDVAGLGSVQQRKQIWFSQELEK